MAVGYGPLSGVTVVDLTQFLSGPLATMIMADLGADVIKVERPDRPKASGPFLNGERVYDLSVQRSKKSITLNLKAETDKKVLLELVKKADVLVENFKPGTMERMGLGYDIIAAANPRIIYMAVSGFGYTGPYRSRGALDMIVQGMSGLMSLTGEPDGPAMRCGTSASDVFTGLYAFGAISAALYDREKTVYRCRDAGCHLLLPGKRGDQYLCLWHRSPEGGQQPPHQRPLRDVPHLRWRDHYHLLPGSCILQSVPRPGAGGYGGGPALLQGGGQTPAQGGAD